MVAASLNSMTQLEQEAMAGLLQLQTERVQHTPKPDPPQAQPQKGILLNYPQRYLRLITTTLQ